MSAHDNETFSAEIDRDDILELQKEARRERELAASRQILLDRAEGQYAALRALNAEAIRVVDALVLAFDVGDMVHASLNGRGFAALADARAFLSRHEELRRGKDE